MSLFLSAMTGEPVHGQGRAWMLGPFEKPSQGNPVITPTPASRFTYPMTDTVVRWEEHATFNPAAVVKDGRLIADDTPAAIARNPEVQAAYFGGGSRP